MATISKTPISQDKIDEFPDFISAFMPDSVPDVPAKFFDDNTIEEMIDYNINQAELIETTSQNLNQKNYIDSFISRDVILAPYQNYRKLNLILAGLQDLYNYKKIVDFDMDIANNMSYFEELVGNAVSKITGIPNKVMIENEENEESEELTDITIEGTDLEYSVARCEEAIANFKLLYDDTNNKTYIYDAVKMKQIESDANRDFFEKVAKLSGFNKQSDEEKEILEDLLDNAEEDDNAPVATGAPPLTGVPPVAPRTEPPTAPRTEPRIVTPTAPPRTEPPVADPFALPGLRRGGSKKRKTYKRTVKRAKRSKSKRRSF